jgi:hypothetical protein
MATVQQGSNRTRKSFAPIVEGMEDRLVMSAASFTATAVAPTEVNVSWGRVSGASLFRIYVEQPSITPWSLAATVHPRFTNQTVSGLNPGTSYAFDVSFVRGGHLYLETPVVAATLALPHSVPNAPHVSALPVSDSQIQLMWPPVPSTTTYVVSQLVYTSGIQQAQTWKVIGTLPYLDSLGTSPNNFTVVYGLSPGLNYTFSVSAENSYGMSTGTIISAATNFP